jgi:arylformamidase
MRATMGEQTDGPAPGPETHGLVELSHEIRHGMVTYPGLPAPEIGDYLSREESPARYGPGTEFHIGRISMVVNTGTYVDSPFHRFAGAIDVAGLPLSSIADLDGLVISVDPRSPAIDRDVISSYDVRGRAVLIHTGWDRHWGTEQYGTGNPFVTAAAAEWLVDHRAGLVGIDSVNIDDTSGQARPAHTALLAAGIPIVEHLHRLDQLPSTGFRFHAVPPPIVGVGSFPARVYAVLT